MGSNHFVLAQLKAAIQRRFNEIHLIDVCHQSDVYDTESMAYQLIGAIRTFPPQSIHWLYCRYNVSNYDILIADFHQQIVIVPNNGIMSAIHFLDYNAKVHNVSYPEGEKFDLTTYQNLHFKALELAVKADYSHLPAVVQFIQTKPFDTELSLMHDKIITRVIATDTLGNIVLNIQKHILFEHLSERAFYISFFGIKIFSLSPNYSTTYNNNRIGALFNETGFLELFMIGGNLSKLFNISKWKNNKIEIIIDNDTHREINFQART